MLHRFLRNRAGTQVDLSMKDREEKDTCYATQNYWSLHHAERFAIGLAELVSKKKTKTSYSRRAPNWLINRIRWNRYWQRERSKWEQWPSTYFAPSDRKGRGALLTGLRFGVFPPVRFLQCVDSLFGTSCLENMRFHLQPHLLEGCLLLFTPTRQFCQFDILRD